jgi:hypothetical protein
MIERIRRVRDAGRRHEANNPYSASWLIGAGGDRRRSGVLRNR